ncbi:hypothetical protein [Pseudomonas japonica]|uniref:hypothetical protein n=1 Tax=Pseudomonas japonica TaxID=256466 RepID=UPI0015E373B2|nr:hypothetical protein [Pseudomonas japonica]MBA1290053.1 hypothetical protein [Pseudomonas japonica]
MSTEQTIKSGSGIFSKASAVFVPAIAGLDKEKLFTEKVLYHYSEGRGHFFEAYEDVEVVAQGKTQTVPLGIWLFFPGESPEKHVSFFRLGEIFVELKIQMAADFIFNPQEGQLKGSFTGSFSLYQKPYEIQSGTIEHQFIPVAELKKRNPYTSSQGKSS